MRSRISSFLLPSWATLSPFFADVRTVSRRLPFCASLSRFLWAGAALGCRLPKVRGLLETPDWHNGPLLELSRATSPLKYDSECRGLANIQRQFPPRNTCAMLSMGTLRETLSVENKRKSM